MGDKCHFSVFVKHWGDTGQVMHSPHRGCVAGRGTGSGNASPRLPEASGQVQERQGDGHAEIGNSFHLSRHVHGPFPAGPASVHLFIYFNFPFGNSPSTMSYDTQAWPVIQTRVVRCSHLSFSSPASTLKPLSSRKTPSTRPRV